MVRASNDRILSEYLIKYGAAKSSEHDRPTDLLEALHIAERYQAGDDLKAVRDNYVRIPGSSRPPFRFDPGRDSEMMPATIPSNSRPPGRE